MKAAFDKVKKVITGKELVPLLLHVRINKGRIQATCLNMTLEAVFPDDSIDITVPADMFGKAVAVLATGFTAKVKGNNLIMSDNSTNIKIPLAKNDEFPAKVLKETGTTVPCNGIKDLFSVLKNFIGNDASRPWSCGVLLKDKFAYATNNVCIARAEFSEVPVVNIPDSSVNIVLTKDEEPTHMDVHEDSVVFHYADGTWFHTALLDTGWPDLARFFGNEPETELHKDTLSIVSKIAKFVPDTSSPILILDEKGISTLDDDRGAIDSTLVFSKKSSFRADFLINVLEVSTHVDFDVYPNPVPFRGSRCEGMIMGVRS